MKQIFERIRRAIWAFHSSDNELPPWSNLPWLDATATDKEEEQREELKMRESGTVLPQKTKAKHKLVWSLDAHKMTDDVVNYLVHQANDRGSAETESPVPEGYSPKQFGDHVRWVLKNHPEMKGREYRYRRLDDQTIHVRVFPREARQ